MREQKAQEQAAVVLQSRVRGSASRKEIEATKAAQAVEVAAEPVPAPSAPRSGFSLFSKK